MDANLRCAEHAPHEAAPTHEDYVEWMVSKEMLATVTGGHVAKLTATAAGSITLTAAVLDVFVNTPVTIARGGST